MTAETTLHRGYFRYIGLLFGGYYAVHVVIWLLYLVVAAYAVITYYLTGLIGATRFRSQLSGLGYTVLTWFKPVLGNDLTLRFGLVGVGVFITACFLVAVLWRVLYSPTGHIEGELIADRYQLLWSVGLAWCGLSVVGVLLWMHPHQVFAAVLLDGGFVLGNHTVWAAIGALGLVLGVIDLW